MLYALIVLYNKNIEDSETYKILRNYSKNFTIIIYDNSTIVNNNLDFCIKNNIQYYGNGKNLGLSKAYNFVLNKIDKKVNNYICIFDDDTLLNKDYIDEVLLKTRTNEYDIILPIVKSNGVIISPCNIVSQCRVININNVDDIKIDKITAINSGMAIRTKLYDSIQYNEKLFLDYVDHDFMKNVRNNNYKINIMNSCIHQKYSRHEKQNIESVRARFYIFKKDYKIYCKDCKKMMFYYFSICKLKIKNFIKYKKII